MDLWKGLTATFQTSTVPLTVVAVYAPTEPSDPSKKAAFYAQLSSVLDSVPRSHTQLILGDFNAQVGKDQPHTAVGRFGLHLSSNANGALLLDLCSAHNLLVTGTLFKHKAVHLRTWYSNNQRDRHQIDHVLISSRDRRMVLDTRVKRGAELDTDHRLLISDLRLVFRKPKRAPAQPRYSVVKLQDPDTRAAYQASLSAALHQNPSPSPTAQSECDLLQAALADAAQQHLKPQKRPRLPWITAETMELIAAKQQAWQLVLSDESGAAKVQYRAAKQAVSSAVLADKTRFLNNLSDQVNDALQRNNHHLGYKLLRELRQPSCRQTPRLRDAQGALLCSPTARLKRLAQFACDLLNTHRSIDPAIHDILLQLAQPIATPSSITPTPPPRPTTRSQTRRAAAAATAGMMVAAPLPQQPSIATPTTQTSPSATSTPPVVHACVSSDSLEPTLAEVQTAIKRLRNGTAAGICNTLPEMLKYGGEAGEEWLHRVILLAWQTESAPEVFSKDIIKFLHKKGDSSVCDNYRTITLQSVIGKVYTSILRARLQQWLEAQLLEPQCGFRPGRGCNDALFTLRQLAEQCVAKKQSMYCCFLDLTKAFDSADRGTLWQIMHSRGAPAKLTALVRNLHDNHQCAVRAEQLQSDWFPVSTGVKQGDVLAPMFFNLYLDTIVQQLLPQLQAMGASIWYTLNGQLTEAKHPTHEQLLWVLMYADDAVLVCHTATQLQAAVLATDIAFTQWGLAISVAKTKVMVIGAAPPDSGPPVIQCQGQTLEVVDQFRYLGSMVASDGCLDAEIGNRLKLAGHAWHSLKLAKVWADKRIATPLKLKVYASLVMSILLYSCETWAALPAQVQRLEVFHMRCLRSICCVSLWDHVRNADILKRCQMSSIASTLQQRRLRWLGHVGRMADCRIPKRMLFGQLLGKRPRGRPRTRWQDIIHTDLDSVFTAYNGRFGRYDWASVCQDRDHWRRLVAGVGP